MATGICNAVYPSDVNGNVAAPPLSAGDPAAVDIFFEMNVTLANPPQDQLDLKRDVERVLHAITRLFLDEKYKREERFRPYYVQLVNLAALGLAGPNASPELAKRALENITAELIDTEGPAIKNGHLGRLTKVGLCLAIGPLVLYVLLSLYGQQPDVAAFLRRLSVDPQQLSSFMILWVGCFVGVVLSYGSRTTTMTLHDLIVTDADYLSPLTRHLFAGTLTMMLGILLGLGIFEIKITGLSSKQLIADPTIAFLIGSFCGLSELVLPGAVSKRAGEVLGLK